VGSILVQLLRDHPGALAVVAAVAASLGAMVATAVAHFGYRKRTEQFRAHIALLKEQQGRRLDEFARLAWKQEHAAPAPPAPPVMGDADVTDRMRTDLSDRGPSDIPR
jgi:hypothetical protein